MVKLAGTGEGEGTWTVYIDGGARGNPGPAAAAGVIRDGPGRETRLCAYLGVTSNNVAEYMALIWVLEEACRAGVSRVVAYSDSELLVRQVTGLYRVRSPRLVPLHRRARELASGVPHFEIHHVGREGNRVADALVNRVLDWAEKYLASPTAPGPFFSSGGDGEPAGTGGAGGREDGHEA